MSKRRRNKRNAARTNAPSAHRVAAPRTKRLAAAVCLALVLLASVGILAARRGSRPRPQAPDSILQTQDSRLTPQSTTPSKQYIYAGGKLIATVEGAGPPPPPPASGPITLSADSAPGVGVWLLWTFSGSGQQNFKVERKAVSDTGFSQISTTGPQNFTYLDEIGPGTYQYQVVAGSSAGDSAPSNPVTVNVPSGPPPAPTGLTATYNPSGPEIDLSWGFSGTTETGFKVERAPAPAGGSFSQIATVCQSPPTYIDKTVSGPAGYFYQVKAYNEAGDSGYSTSLQVNIPPPAPAASINCATSVQISWTESATVDSFNVFRNGNPLASGITGTSYTDASAPPQTTVSYTVQAHTASFGDSAQSNTVSCMTPSGCQVSTLSGNGVPGYHGGIGTQAKWNNPQAAVVGIDPASNQHALFVADRDNSVIRMIYLDGPSQGAAILLAGTPGTSGYAETGDPTQALYNSPQGIATITNSSGVVQTILIADVVNDDIRELNWSGSAWTTANLAGVAGRPGNQDGGPGQGQKVLFSSPFDMVLGTDANIYVADWGNGDVRRLTQGGVSSQFVPAGGPIPGPHGIIVSPSSGLLYVADDLTSSIYSINPAGSAVRIAGTGSTGYADGTGSAAAFFVPAHLAWTNAGSVEVLYIADRGNNAIRKLTVSTSNVTTYAGSLTSGYSDGGCGAALFSAPTGMAAGLTTEIYVTDAGNNVIRKVQ